MTLFVATFTLFAITCMSSVFIDAKIQRHIFVNHPKLWKSFGYPTGFRWLVPSAQESEYNKASFQLASFLKSPKCEALSDGQLLKLIELSKLIQKIAIATFMSVVIVGCITWTT